jgi:DNA recombination protein RmuC
MTQHFSKMGRHVHQMVDSYNSTVASFERRVLVSARKFQDIDSSLDSKAIDTLVQLEALPRSLEQLGDIYEKNAKTTN